MLAALLACATHCSLLVANDLSQLRCSQDGAIGLPACDPGQICAEFRCRSCVALEICGDGIDNDCNGQRDDGCSGEGVGAGGMGGAGSNGGAAGLE